MEKNEQSFAEKSDTSRESLAALLFFDTFAHESCEKNNLDVVQFPKPVLIEKIAVIPLGKKIEADFPGGVRLGATNPSSFPLQFNVNDLTKSNSSTFSNFGCIDYKECVNEVYAPIEKKATDAVIIRGSYRTLTLAIFGEVTDLSSIVTQSETPSTTPVSEPSSYSVTTNCEPEKIVNKTTIMNCNEDDLDWKPMIDRNFETLISPSIIDDFKLKLSPDSPKQKESGAVIERKAEKDSLTKIDGESTKERDLSMFSLGFPQLNTSSYSANKRSRSKSPTVYKDNHRNRSPQSKWKSSSPPHKRRSPHSTRSSRSPKSVRSRSPRSIKSLSPSPRYFRQGSPSSRSQKSSRSIKSTSSTSHSPALLTENSSRNEKVLYDFSSQKLSKDNKNNSSSLKNPLPLDSELLEPVSSEHSPLSAENVSDDGDMDLEFTNENNDILKECDDFEAISSEEEYIDDIPADDSDVMLDYSEYPMNDYSYIWTFNHFQCEFTPVNYFEDPATSSLKIKCTQTDKERTSEVMTLMGSFKTKATKNEKWIEAVETVASELDLLELNSDMRQCLVEWVLEGLDYDLAMKQPLTGFKVRHMKAGIKLLIALFDTRGEVVESILSTEALRMLMDLYFKPYMSLPVKLLITRGFDAVCNSAIGVDHIVHHRYRLENVKGGVEETCYQMLLSLVLNKPPSRLTAALVALLRKIHYFECFALLKTMVCDNEPREKNEFTKLRSLLIEIVSTFKKAKLCLSQRLRYLPASSQFQVNEVLSNIYHAIYNWMKYHKTLDCLLRIYNNSDLESLTEYCDEFIAEVLNEENGPLFFLGKDVVMKSNDIQRILVQNCEDSENQSKNIGFRFSFTLQANYLIDCLFSMQKQDNFDVNRACDDPEMASTFHRLYALVFSIAGRRAVVESLTSVDNIKVLFPFLLATGNKKADLRLSKSVCAGYAVELCLLTVQSCEKNIINLVKNHGETLLQISSNEYIPKLSVLSSWLCPLKNDLRIAYDEETFKSLVEVIRKCAESASEVGDTGVFVIPCELITVIRILKKLCVNPFKDERNEYGTSNELKYQYGIIQMYTLDSMSLLSTILNKLLDTYLKPSHQSAALVGNQGSLIIYLISPALQIIKEVIHHLTSAQGKDFKDVTPISMFLRIYSLMAIFPTSSFYYSTAQGLCSVVVEILMIYTQICLSVAESEEVFTKSVWTKMLLEVFQYTFSSPLTFLHGLTLFSNLLPLPLPICSPEELKSEEITKLINFRKLWSAHLHVLSAEIDNLINCFVFTSSLCIQQMLRRICIQIADLSATSAVTIVKSVLDLFAEHYPSSEESTSNLYCVLNLLNSLATHPPFKITLIQLIYGSKCEEKYGHTLNKLLAFLRLNVDELVNIATMEITMSIIQSLCDPQISLCPSDSTATSLQNISNSIPPKEALTFISNSLINQITTNFNRKSVPLVTLSFRIMSLLCEHDFGFWSVKLTLLEKFPLALHSFLVNMCAFLENNNSKLDYCKQLLETFLCFLKLMQGVEENSEAANQRQSKLCITELRKLLNWEQNQSESKRHPLHEIRKVIRTSDNMDENLSNGVDWLIQLLDKSLFTENSQKVPQEPILPSPDTLASQFSLRQVFFISEHLSSERQHCFPASAEFFDYESSLIGDTKRINLQSMSDEYCGTEFDLKAALEDLCKCEEPGELSINVSTDVTINKKHESLLSQKDSMQHTTAKIPFVAPMRGRGFQRQGMSTHLRVNDPFRSRPPNTSRPPSMHVDDFVALEQGRSDNFSTMKRPSKDYRSCSPNSRTFGVNVVPRPVYYATELYANRRTHQLSPPPMHQTSRSARYSRENYSPQGSRSRLDSLGPASGQHWNKLGIAGSRRDSRETRDSRQSRPFPR